MGPGKWGAVFQCVLFVLLGFFEGLGMALFEPHPFDLLLEEAERASTARAPIIIFRDAHAGRFQDIHHTLLVDPGLAERKTNFTVSC